jgi:hypothetical protein
MHKWSWGNGGRFVAPKDISTPEARVNSTQGDSNHKTPKHPNSKEKERQNLHKTEIVGEKTSQTKKQNNKKTKTKLVQICGESATKTRHSKHDKRRQQN